MRAEMQIGFLAGMATSNAVNAVHPWWAVVMVLLAVVVIALAGYFAGWHERGKRSQVQGGKN